VKVKLFLLIGASAACAFASTITFTGPSAPVIGDPLQFDIFYAKLTQPALPGTPWTLTIGTNYGAAIGGDPVVPGYQYGNVGVFSIGDFLINWDGSLYGVALTSHDGYQAGDLYQVPGFQTSGSIMGVFSTRPNVAVELGAGGGTPFGSNLPLGTGTLSGASTGFNGSNGPEFTLTDVFSAPAGFLSSGDFTIQMSSYACANGYITGTGNLAGGTTGSVPEPGGLLLAIPALALFLFCKERRRANRL
jgi:hypothetical protein